MSAGSYASLFDPGILRSALLPSLHVHAALAVPAFLLARTVDSVEVKDLLWSSGQVANAWYAAVGRPMLYAGIPLTLALNRIGRPGRLLLTGITLWGARLFYRVLSRRLRRGEDDPRYASIKESGSWTLSGIKLFAGEALFQAIIALGYTMPFTVPSAPVLLIKDEWRAGLEMLAIGTWAAGMGMEVLADWQVERYKASGGRGLCREGVWSIVRHPNYLGDLLTHISYPFLLLPHGLFNPFALLGPLANWAFLRFVGGDAESEASQLERYAPRLDPDGTRTEGDPEKMLDLIESRETKNAFWPAVREVGNRWVWVCIGIGAAGVWAERLARPQL